MNDRKELGRFGETFTMQYLTRVLGWNFVAQNWRCRIGELDLLYRDGETFVVVEVRTRRFVDRGEVINAVGVAKVRQLRRLVPFVVHRFAAEEVRIDVVALSVQGKARQSFTVQELIHVRNIDVQV